MATCSWATAADKVPMRLGVGDHTVRIGPWTLGPQQGLDLLDVAYNLLCRGLGLRDLRGITMMQGLWRPTGSNMKRARPV